MKKLKKKSVILLGVILTLTILIGTSYGFFILSTNNYKASELLVSELLYGITIEEDGSNISTIENNKVTVPSGQKVYLNITISNINKIDTKYTLAYKSTNNAVVKYTDKTDWASQGYIKGYDESTYSKTVRVVIDNIEESNSSEVMFTVYGGYTFNSYTSISLKDGYYSVSGPYNEVLAVKTGRLVDIIETNTKCITSESNNCLYSGGSINNYIQYPEDTDKTKNIWRIIGTYKDENTTITKLISENNTTTTASNISTSLTSFYNTLDNKEAYIYKTNKFNCSNAGCTTSSYNNIGLISTYEYEMLGGINSYLSPNNSYFALNNASIENITQEGIVSTTNETVSGLRPSIYLNTEVKVTGAGTVSDPYVINNQSDINLIAYTLKGEETEMTYAELLNKKVVDTVKCSKGTKAVWNYSNNTITLSDVVVPDYCTIDFTDGYKVTLSAPNGNVTTANPVGVGYGRNVTFTVTPSVGYTLTGSTVSCTNSQTGSINETTGVVTVSNVTSATTCTVTLPPDKLTLYAQILEDHKTRLIRSSFSSVFTSSNTGTLYTVDGNWTEGGKTVYYFAGNALDNWVKFGKDSSGNDLYWRIIRTNEDGSVRLLYVGTSMNTTSGYIAIQNFNSSTDNPMYVGYMYGSSGSLASNRTNATNSPIKTVVDTWYNGSLNTKTDTAGNTYDKYVSRTAIYCNDRAHEGTYTTVSSSGFTYASAFRTYYEKTPSYKCGNSKSGTLYSNADNADRFSASTSTTYTNGVSAGNGLLQYPVALITADEIVFAGGRYSVNAETWYYYNSANGSVTGERWWCTMSPLSWERGVAVIFLVRGSASPGRLDYYGTAGDYAVRPVLSLKSCVKTNKGDGSVSNPYEVSIDSICANRDN